MESAEASDQAPPTEEEGPSSSSSADALKAAGQIMTLEGEAKGCLDRCARARFFLYFFIFFSVPLRPFCFFVFALSPTSLDAVFTPNAPCLLPSRRLDELERQLNQQRRAFDAAEMNAEAMKSGGNSRGGGGSSSASSISNSHRFGHASSVSDINAQIAAAKADLAKRAERDVEAKERFKEMEKSIATSEEHLANLELMSVQTPELMGLEAS